MKEMLLKHKKLGIVILAAILILLLLVWIVFSMIHSSKQKKLDLQNETPIFKVSKIMIYNGADAIDHSEEALSDLSICQYTDIALYLDNFVSEKELTESNTINQLYIDHISMESSSEKGSTLLNYKNPLSFGKFKQLKAFESDRINFDVVHTNREDLDTNYNSPTFFTDCSNPISLGYIRSDLVTKGMVGANDTPLAFDGSILKASGITLADISCTLKFQIHIVNNKMEEFVCDVSLDLVSEKQDQGIYDGYTLKTLNVSDDQSTFKRIK